MISMQLYINDIMSLIDKTHKMIITIQYKVFQIKTMQYIMCFQDEACKLVDMMASSYQPKILERNVQNKQIKKIHSII